MRRGVTLLELLVTIAIIGIGAAIIVPRLRPSRRRATEGAARALQGQIELTRTRAMAFGALARVCLTSGPNAIFGYLDDDRNVALNESQVEKDAFGNSNTFRLPDGVVFGRGGATALPGYPAGDQVTFPDMHLDFDSRGLPTPLGTRGVIYLQSATDSTAVAALGVTPAGTVQLWVWRNGTWR